MQWLVWNVSTSSGCTQSNVDHAPFHFFWSTLCDTLTEVCSICLEKKQRVPVRQEGVGLLQSRTMTVNNVSSSTSLGGGTKLLQWGAVRCWECIYKRIGVIFLSVWFFSIHSQEVLLCEFFSCEDKKQKETQHQCQVLRFYKQQIVLITSSSQLHANVLRLLYRKSGLTFSLLVEVGADLLFADDVCVGNLEETRVFILLIFSACVRPWWLFQRPMLIFREHNDQWPIC